MLQALIFDFDGLIIDTELPDFHSWQEIYQLHGATLSLDVWLPLIGTGTSSRTFHPHDYLEKQLGQSLNRNEIRTMRMQRYVEMVKVQPLLSGVEALISEAQQRGLRLALASSSSREWVVGHLMQRGLAAYFEHIVCGDEVAHTKPAPDVYQTTLAKLGIKADEAIALEDSPNGVLAAKQAGIYCVAVPNPLTMQFLFTEADLRLTSLEELSLGTFFR